ncbi:hypothetical protein RISK_006308 [Rhodopirellula islandica]|uniref:Transmembrane protein n=1 Tax=Rhodopirellula islandica TaxID=595434 RepID=A0A0J1B4B4_RHOIS|nr:hypothetical protein [Rhodopirellula islandica]KLU01592.1 hypothetical protein RISK_006308 [Rhodopirellula islandica]
MSDRVRRRRFERWFLWLVGVTLAFGLRYILSNARHFGANDAAIQQEWKKQRFSEDYHSTQEMLDAAGELLSRPTTKDGDARKPPINYHFL